MLKDSNGLVQRLPLDRILKQAFSENICGRRRVGKPRSTWEDLIQENAGSRLQCCNRRLTAQNGDTWGQDLRQIKA